MSSASSLASVTLSSPKVRLRDPFSGVRFDSVRHGYFFRCLEWLHQLSVTVAAQQQGNSPNATGVEALSSGNQSNSPAPQHESMLALPEAAHWQQILQLRHNVVSLVQQALHEYVRAYPEQAQPINFYLQGIGKKSQISDAEAIDLIQAVEQLVATQETVKFRQGEVTYSGSVARQRREPNVVEEAKDRKVAVSHPPSFPEPPPSVPEDPEDESLKSVVEPGKAAETGGAIVIVPPDKDLIAVKTQDSALATAKASGLMGQGDATGTAQDSLPPSPAPLEQQPRRTAKRYAEIEHPAALVRELRERYQLSQEKFAKKVDVSFITVNRWENGHSMPHDIAIVRLKKLTKKLGDRGEDLLEKHFPDEFEKLRKKQGLNSAKG